MHIFLKLKSDWLGQTNFNDFFLPILTDITLSFRKGNYSYLYRGGGDGTAAQLTPLDTIQSKRNIE
jgi:hypothetical protein